MTSQRVRLSLRRGAATTAATAGLAAALLAVPQSQSPQPIPRFRTGVEGVVVDVSVLDKDRRPVRGLTPADFTVMEDGKPQRITAFTAVDIPDTFEPSSGWMREVAPDVVRNDDVADQRVVVIVLDDATPMSAADVLLAKKSARALIEHLGPHDLVAVFYCWNRRVGQGFTTDRSRLLASVEKFNGAIDNMWEMKGRADSPAVPVPYSSLGSGSSSTLVSRTADTLREVADYLADLPQRRKALVLLSVGIPVDISLLSEGVPSETGMDTTGVVSRLVATLREAIWAAQRSNVTIYGVDPGGLRVGSAGRLNRDFLEGLSASTGGFAITNTNDPNPGFAQIIRENSSYYLLGYQSTDGRASGRYRKVQVRVNRPDVTVRSRRGYFETRPEKSEQKNAAQLSEASLQQAVGAFVAKADVAMQVTAASFAGRNRPESAVAIVVKLTQPAPVGVDRAVETVQLRVNAYEPGGKLRASERLDGRVVLRPTPAGEAVYELLSRLDLEPGRYELRVGAESALRRKSGSVFCDLDVPDLARGSLTLSGVVINVVPGVAVAPRDKLASLLPVVPTSQREFGSSEQVTAFLRVYQPGRKPVVPVGMTVTVLDAAGVKVVDRRETLAPERFGQDRAADYRIALPVSELARGQHLLTVEVTQGKASERRQVRFSVR